MELRRWRQFGWLTAVVASQWLLAALLLPARPVQAQQIPAQHYNIEDGLAHSIVGAIYQDRKGYIWLGTADGLSRFDGYRFTNYGTNDGLDSPIITSITEDRQGRLWVGTNGGGVARLIDDPREASQPEVRSPQRKKFVSYRVGETPESNSVTGLLFDDSGALWCTSDEIYRAVDDQKDHLRFEVAITHKGGWSTFRAFSDSRGRLWFGLSRELIEVTQGRVMRYGPADGLPMERTLSRAGQVFNEQIRCIAEDHTGRLLVANLRELFEFIAPEASVEGRGRWKKLPLSLSRNQDIHSLVFDSQGRLWIGTSKGLLWLTENQQTNYTTAQGIGSGIIFALLEDRQGNVWVGTRGDGVFKSPGDFIVSYSEADGLPGRSISFIVEDDEGHIYAGTNHGEFAEIVARKVVSVSGSHTILSNRVCQWIMRDKRGDYWIRADDGLYRFPGPALQFHTGRKITEADGAPALHKRFGLGLYEDPLGKIWCGAFADRALFVLDPNLIARSAFKRIPLDASVGVPPEKNLDVLHCSIGDRSGELWFAWQADLGRYKDSKVTLLEATEGLPETTARALFIDSRGWLWIGLSSGGLSMTTDPRAERPKFVNYSTRNGLANNAVWILAEDDFGRIYASTGKGLDRIDPSTGQIRHFTAADGLAGSTSNCVKDRRGNIWVGSTTGLSRLNPIAERAAGPTPQACFARVQVAGEDIPLPERGATRIPEFSLSASQNNLFIEYIAVSMNAGEGLKYQHFLEGADRDWGPPGDQRSVNYARLAPGRYRLLVRAVNAEGQFNDNPSIMEFHILPPIWQRWWFIALVAAALASGAFALYRSRVRRIVAVEGIRRQVATDLHDDVGSGLAQIAILSEVAKRDSSPAATSLLNEVADLARSMRDSMSDIVWAVDPRKDRLADLVQRMRQASYNLLEADGVRVDFHAPQETEIERIGLTPNRKRHLLLIFKETVTNIARHAQANNVRVEIGVRASELSLAIRDDGCGFEPETEHDGHGLNSLIQRADELNARLEIESAPGHGTSVKVRLPLK